MAFVCMPFVSNYSVIVVAAVVTIVFILLCMYYARAVHACVSW